MKLLLCCTLLLAVCTTIRGDRPKIACEGDPPIQIGCGEYKFIKITYANYGRTSRTICPFGSRDRVDCRDLWTELKAQHVCDGKHSCSLLPYNWFFDDTCRGIRKYLEVRYTCGQTQVKTACEGSTLTIQCPGGKIMIESAYYGRVIPETIVCLDLSRHRTDCKASGSEKIVRDRCHNKNSCSVWAHNSVFGDPCPWNIKYLRVYYKCN